MVVQESVVGESLHFKNMDEEADETLSFSDLPLYKWEDLYPESQGSSSISSSSEQDYFEFSSQELSPPENLIFCGKIIPYRKPDASENVSAEPVETSIKKTHGWKFGPMSSKRSTTLKHKKDDDQPPTKEKYNSKQQGKEYMIPLHKMPVFTSTSSGKPRWYLFLFGVPKFSSKMEMRDIKSRQSRHSPPPSPAVRFLNHHHDDEVLGATTGGSGLSGLIRILICGGNHHQTTMVDQSITHNRLK